MIREHKTDFEFSKLRIIDLSHNKFTGMIQSKYFEWWDAMKVVDTSELTYMEDEMLPEHATKSFTILGFYSYSLTMSMVRSQIS